jgi:hypothetical protein
MGIDRRLGLCLAGEELGEEAFAEDGPQFEDEILDVGQGSAPGGAIGAMELVGEQSGDAVEVGTNFFYLGSMLFEASHPWVLSRVASKDRSDFPALC